MSATGFTTDSLKNDMASTYTTSCAYFTLLKALTLQSATVAGAASLSVDLAVQAGDVLVLEAGTGNVERVVVGSVSGSGPYAVVPAAPLTKAHAANVRIGHIPLNATTVHEVTVTRVAASWGSPSPAGVVTSGNGAITVPSGNVVGSVAAFTAVTSGTYKDAAAIPALDFTSTGGTYTPAWVETLV